MTDQEHIIDMTDEDIILPEGWTEGDDIFSPETWGKGEGVEEGLPAPETARNTEGADPDPATGQEPQEDDGGQGVPAAPATEQPESQEPKTFKLKVRVDREDRDVEVSERELPDLYERAQATDRYKARLAAVSPRLEEAERRARAMGYDRLEELVSSVEKTWQDGEVSRLVGEGVHQEVARDMVTRRTQPQAQPTAAPAAEAPAQRDFQAEARQLLEARPELRGKSLPEEVVRVCVTTDKSLPVAYAEYEAHRERAEADRLRQENAVLKQNAANAARAPVKGTAGGGSTQQEPEDDFLRGFNSGY